MGGPFCLPAVCYAGKDRRSVRLPSSLTILEGGGSEVLVLRNQNDFTVLNRPMFKLFNTVLFTIILPSQNTTLGYRIPGFKQANSPL